MFHRSPHSINIWGIGCRRHCLSTLGCDLGSNLGSDLGGLGGNLGGRRNGLGNLGGNLGGWRDGLGGNLGSRRNSLGDLGGDLGGRRDGLGGWLDCLGGRLDRLGGRLDGRGRADRLADVSISIGQRDLSAASVFSIVGSIGKLQGTVQVSTCSCKCFAATWHTSYSLE